MRLISCLLVWLYSTSVLGNGNEFDCINYTDCTACANKFPDCAWCASSGKCVLAGQDLAMKAAGGPMNSAAGPVSVRPTIVYAADAFVQTYGIPTVQADSFRVKNIDFENNGNWRDDVIRIASDNYFVMNSINSKCSAWIVSREACEGSKNYCQFHMSMSGGASGDQSRQFDLSSCQKCTKIKGCGYMKGRGECLAGVVSGPFMLSSNKDTYRADSYIIANWLVWDELTHWVDVCTAATNRNHEEFADGGTLCEYYNSAINGLKRHAFISYRDILRLSGFKCTIVLTSFFLSSHYTLTIASSNIVDLLSDPICMQKILRSSISDDSSVRISSDCSERRDCGLTLLDLPFQELILDQNNAVGKISKLDINATTLIEFEININDNFMHSSRNIDYRLGIEISWKDQSYVTDTAGDNSKMKSSSQSSLGRRMISFDAIEQAMAVMFLIFLLTLPFALLLFLGIKILIKYRNKRRLLRLTSAAVADRPDYLLDIARISYSRWAEISRDILAKYSEKLVNDNITNFTWQEIKSKGGDEMLPEVLPVQPRDELSTICTAADEEINLPGEATTAPDSADLEQCCICISDFVSDEVISKLTASCNHMFHQDCLSSYLASIINKTIDGGRNDNYDTSVVSLKIKFLKSAKCPLCRQYIFPVISVLENATNTIRLIHRRLNRLASRRINQFLVTRARQARLNNSNSPDDGDDSEAELPRNDAFAPARASHFLLDAQNRLRLLIDNLNRLRDLETTNILANARRPVNTDAVGIGPALSNAQESLEEAHPP